MIPIIFSTVTGNAFKIAEGIKEAVPNYIGPYNVTFVNDEMINEYDTWILVYWCNHGTMDDYTIDLLKKLKNKKVIILGSLGASVDSPHALKVKENVQNCVSLQNEMLGQFLCRGAIDLKRTYKRTLIPEGEKGHLSKERFEKQKESLGHPDKVDIKNAYDFVRSFLNNEKKYYF